MMASRVLATTFPKTGTHLLRQILGPHRFLPPIKGFTFADILAGQGVAKPDRNQGWPVVVPVETVASQLSRSCGTIVGHLPYAPAFVDAARSRPTVVVLLIRDPRDTAVAHVYSAKGKRPGNLFNFLFEDGLRLSEKPDPLREAIKCAPAWWAAWLPWVGEADVVLRFEDLVGPARATVIEALADTIGGGFSAADAMARIKPRASLTFRKGVAGEWKKEFSPQHVGLFNATMGGVMEALGYSGAEEPSVEYLCEERLPCTSYQL